MAQWLTLIVGILYLIAGLDFIRQKNYNMCITFICWGMANISLYFATS